MLPVSLDYSFLISSSIFFNKPATLVEVPMLCLKSERSGKCVLRVLILLLFVSTFYSEWILELF